MKFRVSHGALADAVAWVARELPSRPVVPVLAGMRLEAGGDGLVLSCFDYDLAAAIQVDAEVDEPGTTLVPGRLLAEITRALPAEPAEFTLDGEEVLLRSGSAEFSLVALPIAEYPRQPEPPPVAGTVDGGELAVAISQVLPAASRDDTLAVLTAVSLEIDGGTLTLAATDRYRLAVRRLAWEPADPDLRTVALVPARTLADAARLMAAGSPVSLALEPEEMASEPDAEAGRDAEGGADDGADAGRRAGADQKHGVSQRPAAAPRPAQGMIFFDSGGRRLAGRLIAGEFLRYESRFPAEFGCRAELAAASFTQAVQRVSLVAERASPVRLTFGDGKVVVDARTEGRARATETVTASFHGDSPVISFSPQYLLDGLAAAAAGGVPDGAEDGAALQPAIRLQFSSPGKPALITATTAGGGDRGETPASQDGTGDGQPGFRYLMVPLRPPADS